jgi:thymidine phosphorylase
MREIPQARLREPLLAGRSGRIVQIDNRKIGRLAKLAGAPEAKSAGIAMLAREDAVVVAGQPLCTVHADAPGELAYAMSYARANADIFRIEDV